MSIVQGIAQQCITSGSARDAVMACLSTLNGAWQSGIESMLNCSDCAQAAQYLLSLTASCSNLPAEFKECVVNPRMCAVLVYVGVRMF